MKADELFNFYKSLYFYELDSRDKLTGRLQLALAALTALLGALSYIGLNLAPSTSGHAALGIFIVFYSISVVLIGLATYHYVRALWDHSYECLPMATDIDEYRVKLVDTYKDYDDGGLDVDLHFVGFLSKYFRECAAKNAEVNQLRGERLHLCFSFIVYALAPLALAAITFVANNFVQSLGS